MTEEKHFKKKARKLSRKLPPVKDFDLIYYEFPVIDTDFGMCVVVFKKNEMGWIYEGYRIGNGTLIESSLK